jgi:hypothetical protein
MMSPGIGFLYLWQCHCPFCLNMTGNIGVICVAIEAERLGAGKMVFYDLQEIGLGDFVDTAVVCGKLKYTICCQNVLGDWQNGLF